MKVLKRIFVTIVGLFVLLVFVDVLSDEEEPTKTSQSEYNLDITKATSSYGLSNADLACHAKNTFGWNCNEVVERGEQRNDYYMITCAIGLKLRVYPRSGQHPRITNALGGYD